ncbi:hypothetical protein DERF_010976 [Dermatophagoides farinae]|uniref:Uncharacterized protein n=1 Tax=Dermatophagoides farinae TaxID=6954 RepID=A0A922HU19_DERFA|nr:hypothetical protein DERF_010976 [Dermatophagoides farinae]
MLPIGGEDACFCLFIAAVVEMPSNLLRILFELTSILINGLGQEEYTCDISISIDFNIRF